MPSAATAKVRALTTGTGTTPRLAAKACQISRPAMMPTGTPMTIPARATVVVC